ncbi:MAG: diaminopimelate epimerase [Longimicrobiales bacterium]
MTPVRFSKGEAIGNDYIVIDRADLPFELSAAQVKRICDRHRGIGSDGILLADLRTDIALRIFNTDGTEAEKSGNGLRIFGAWLHGRGLVADNQWFAVRLVKDTVRMRVEEHLAGGQLMIRAEMGRATFHGADVDFTPSPGETLDYPLDLGDGLSARINTVSLSNRHCVVFVDALERADFEQRAPRLCDHPAFAHSTNVQLARVKDAHTLEAWIWERGVGETLASGSSSCAVAAAAVKRGFVQPGTFRVEMPGGYTEVEIGEDYDVKLLGPAGVVFGGELRGEVLAS